MDIKNYIELTCEKSLPLLEELIKEARTLSKGFKRKGRNPHDIIFIYTCILLKKKIYEKCRSQELQALRELFLLYEKMQAFKTQYFQKQKYKSYSNISREIINLLEIDNEMLLMPPKNLYFQYLLTKFEFSETINKNIYEMYEKIIKFQELKYISAKHLLSALIDIYSTIEPLNITQANILDMLNSDAGTLIHVRKIIIEKLELEPYKKIKNYDETEVEAWRGLHEKLGNFRAVEREIKKLHGDGPSHVTIIDRLKKSKNIMYLSDFFNPSKFGEISGTCISCGRITFQGLEIDYSKKFTNWELLQAGDCICPNCYELTRNQAYRRKMWVATKGGVKFFKKKEMLELLLNPPEPPFSIYLTKTYQKQGFFNIINRVNYSRDDFIVAYDMNVINVNLEEFKKMVEMSQDLRNKNITKTELRTGKFYPGRFEMIDIKIIEKIKQEYIKNPSWELTIDAIE